MTDHLPNTLGLPPMDAERQAWVEAAWNQLDVENIRQLNLDIVNVHSPMGFERELAEWLAARMQGSGISSHVQVIDDLSGNAIGRYGNRADGATLMLYAPTDTHIAHDTKIDLPWVGEDFRADMVTPGYVTDVGDVVGLGAANPKAGIAAQIAALEAVVKAGIPLRGEVVAAYCGGGMPAHSEPGYPRQGIGLGSGAFHMVREGVTADFGVICKPLNLVLWEEPGLAWFKVSTRGPVMYAGLPKEMPGYSNTIADLAKIATAIEEWLPTYARLNTSGLVKPEGALGALRANVPSRVAIPPGAAELYIDLRITPRMTPMDAWRQLDEVVRQVVKANPHIDAKVEMIAAYPSASTDPAHWIIQSTTRAWEAVEGQRHPVPTPFSGQTDASLLRNLGIPLARVGCELYNDGPFDWSRGIGGMGVSHIPHVERLARKLVQVIVDSCTRPLSEIQIK
ncbi:acetylornithine deacetylase/succinyldiaminopimelate desuccinylase-like deacylase [Burkholderia sp. Ch1-1]|nr:acetylornithine deacetylase/succinyldiaminopimelate desuccinylase-like deacylase [Burkholderia sp. Ch1-1]